MGSYFPLIFRCSPLILFLSSSSHSVHISAIALLKMAMHAAKGGDLEVMGILQGKVVGRSLIVLDAFALPVEGTETRVNAQAEANEFLIDWLETGSTGGSGHPEHAVGWYHSHPGYGCWLSGVDVATQATQQRWADPFVAVVVDPHRTLASGRVELGAFRTYPEGYVPPGDDGRTDPASGARYEAVPLAKVEDFGVHCKSYYPLEVSYFKSASDAALLSALWGRYWAATLAASPLAATRALAAGQTGDVAGKLAAAGGADAAWGRGGADLPSSASLGGAGLVLPGGVGGGGGGWGGGASSKQSDDDRFGALGRGPAPPGRAAVEGDGGPGGASASTPHARLASVCVAASKLAAEQAKGAASQVVKALLFNRGLLGGGGAAAAVCGGGGGGGAGAAAGNGGGDAMETA